MNTYRYTASVNGQQRSVTFTADPRAWGRDAGEHFDLGSAEMLIDNEYDVYTKFYDGAIYDDYNADRESAALDLLTIYGFETIDED